ncbi:MAG: FtsX-like permease family protein [Cyclobacteriaceae bacterium]
MSKPAIPSGFSRLFEWFCKPSLFEELQGDMEEAFEENTSQFGLTTARNIYRKEVIKMIRPSVIRGIVPKRFNHSILFKNYFKTSYRSMIKNPMTSFINVFGLAVALGICLVVYAFFEYDKSIDQFHENKNSVYLATFFVDRDGTEQQFGISPTPLGEMLKADFPQVTKSCRIEDRNVVMKYDDKVFHEEVRFVDPTFLEMFTFPLETGVKGSINEVNNIILSNEMAIKYFGDENPIGQNIQVIFGEGNSKSFAISGVAEVFPDNRTIDFDFLINFENFYQAVPEFNPNDWAHFIDANLIQVANAKDLATIQRGMDKYIEIQNAIETDWAIKSFEFEPLANLHFASSNMRNSISFDGNEEARMGMPVIGIIMLVLACFNYLNIAVVSASKRLKEIGLRKVIGANRALVAVQFLTENILVTAFALVVGILLAATLFMPWLQSFSGWVLSVDLVNPDMWIFLGSVVLITGIVSGIYPAVYISKFEAVKIFKGNVRFGKRNPLTQIFLGIQLVLTCAGITIAVLYSQNNDYQRQRSWGYNQQNALYTEVADEAAFTQLSDAMSQHSMVESLSGSVHHLGREISTAVIQLPGRKYEVRQLLVGANYLETHGVELLDGRNFVEKSANDKQAIIVNESLVKGLGLPDPIGEIFKIDSSRFEIIGVTKDFHIYSFSDLIRPTIFRVADEQDFQYLSFKVADGQQKQAYEALQTEWATLFPEIPFQGGYQEDVWDDYFQYLTVAEGFFRALAIIAVLLASLGLYGLITLNVAGRTKEFSIRKALGAGISNLSQSIGQRYVILFSISLLVGVPFSYWLGKASLEMLYAYPMPITTSGMLISLVMLLSVLLLVISTQVRKVITTSPVKGLRTE